MLKRLYLISKHYWIGTYNSKRELDKGVCYKALTVLPVLMIAIMHVA